MNPKPEKEGCRSWNRQELNLYLDTHPEDLKAIEQFNQLTQERTKLANQFQELYGPLQNFGRAYSKCPWEWNQTPWPWQV